jgi:hypothetical protein
VIHPSPATSTTFSCQLSSTLIAAPLFSPPAPGRPDIWLKPPDSGAAARGELTEGVEELAIPLYLGNMLDLQEIVRFIS